MLSTCWLSYNWNHMNEMLVSIIQIINQCFKESNFLVEFYLTIFHELVSKRATWFGLKIIIEVKGFRILCLKTPSFWIFLNYWRADVVFRVDAVILFSSMQATPSYRGHALNRAKANIELGWWYSILIKKLLYYCFYMHYLFT